MQGEFPLGLGTFPCWPGNDPASAMEVLPGERVGVSTRGGRLGPGLHSGEEGEVRASVPGLLRGKPEHKMWVDFSKKRYVPAKNERVLGIVTRTGRHHRVDIGSAVSAVLPELAFEGATKRTKPALQVGEVVYACVTRAHKDMEPELSCVDPSGKSNGLGPLPVSGYLLHCSLGLCRKLLSDSSPVLTALGKRFKYECVVGMNGRVLVNSSTLVHTIAIVNAITSSEFMSVDQCHQMVSQIIDRL